jgi:hypothetical protein
MSIIKVLMARWLISPTHRGFGLRWSRYLQWTGSGWQDRTRQAAATWAKAMCMHLHHGTAYWQERCSAMHNEWYAAPISSRERAIMAVWTLRRCSGICKDPELLSTPGSASVQRLSVRAAREIGAQVKLEHWPIVHRFGTCCPRLLALISLEVLGLAFVGSRFQTWLCFCIHFFSSCRSWGVSLSLRCSVCWVLCPKCPFQNFTSFLASFKTLILLWLFLVML